MSDALGAVVRCAVLLVAALPWSLTAQNHSVVMPPAAAERPGDFELRYGSVET